MARACLSSRRVKDFRVVTAQPFSWLMDFRRGTRSIVNIAEVGGEFWELAVYVVGERNVWIVSNLFCV